jgi:hypothetical protein
MNIFCRECRQDYDDAAASTICPHDDLYPPEILKQKDLGIALVGKRVHFNHRPASESYRVTSMSWNGMIGLDGLPGEFAPHLFKVVSDE